MHRPADGRRTSLTRGNGIVTSYSYDPASRLTSLAHNFGGNGNDVTLSFGHNAASQITSRSDMHNAYAFTSSVAGTRTDTHNGRNEIWTVNGTQIAHDARGNLTNDGFRSFAYTSDNLMTQAGGASLFYDPLDRLRFVQGGGNEQLVYDGAELIVEYNMSGTALLRRYVHGPGVDEPLVWYEGSGTADRRWMTADERGSIIGTFNDARGGLGYVAYDEYGRRQVLGTPGRFGFTGQQWLAEIGMYYFRARMYDPDGTRFPQPDPIGYGDGLNLYTYAASDPVNRIDPTGMAWWPSRMELKRSDGPGGTVITRWGPSSGPSSGGGLLDSDGNVRVDVANNIYWERSDGSGGQWGGNIVARGGNFYLAGGRTGTVTVLAGDVAAASGELGDNPGMGHNEPPRGFLGILRIIIVRGAGIIGGILSMRGDSCPSCAPTPPPAGVPSNWTRDFSQDGQPMWRAPSHPNHNYVRIRSDGTITQVKNGQALDVHGNPVPHNSPAAHFPRNRFVFRN